MQRQYRVVIGLAVAIIATSTVFFHYVEGWSWVDSYFFTIVTISTVGYGNFVPVTVIGKLGTTVLILLGIGVVAVALNFFGSELVSARVSHLERNKKRKSREKE